jgi:hypothetical protein
MAHLFVERVHGIQYGVQRQPDSGVNRLDRELPYGAMVACMRWAVATGSERRPSASAT